MANNSDNKISIEVEINASGQQQLNQYKNAFDGLRTSINNLSDPITKLDSNVSKLSDSINKMGAQNQSSNDILNKLVDGFLKAKNVLEVFEMSMAGLRIGVISLQAALTGGLTLLLAFGPQLLEIAKGFFKGKEASEQAKMSLDNYNKALSSTEYSNAIQNVKSLNINVELAKKGLVDKTEVVKTYNKTMGQTTGQIKTLDEVEKVLKNNAASYIQVMLHKAIAMNAIKEAAENQIKAEKELAKSDEESIKYTDSGLKGKMREDAIKRTKEAAAKPFRDASKTLTDIAEKEINIVAGIENTLPVNSLKRKIEALQKQTSKGIIDPKVAKELKDLKQQLKEIDPNAANDVVAPVNKVRVRVNPSKETKKNTPNEAEEERLNSVARLAEINLTGYAKEVADSNEHFEKLKQKFIGNNATVEQLEKERVAALVTINEKYQNGDLKKLDIYKNELLKIHDNAGKTAQQLAIDQVQEEYSLKRSEIDKEEAAAQKQQELIIKQQYELRTKGRYDDANALDKALQNEIDTVTRAGDVKKMLEQKQLKDIQKIKDDATTEQVNKEQKDSEKTLQNNVNKAENAGDHLGALQQQKLLLDSQYNTAIAAAVKQGKDTLQIEEEFKNKKARLDEQLFIAKIHIGDKFIDATLKNTKKDSAIYKAAFLAKKATSIADTIISTKEAVMKSFGAYASIPFVGQALGIVQAAFMAGQGAMSIAEIAKQKPGFAQGGQFISDGRGALLSGYSRTDNTNAYLRSGEAVVVSEAMRDPWARNLVSAINVAYGGRDFSMSNPGRGYAIGGIFTDGGNSNRYYNQPMNDQKELANTIAYQMMNNFPPVYVDVKDINTQQNIMAQTINRVNL